MRLTSIQIEQIGPYRGERLSFQREGLHVYAAANEAGKSSLVLALRGALFGQARTAEGPTELSKGATVRLQLENEEGEWVQLERNLSKRNPPKLHFANGQTVTGQQELIRTFPELESVEQILYETFFTIQLADLMTFAERPGALASQLFGVRAPLFNPYLLEADLEKRSREIYISNRRATKPALNALAKEINQLDQELRTGRDKAGWYRLASEEKTNLLVEEKQLIAQSAKLAEQQVFLERCMSLRDSAERFIQLEIQLSLLGNCPSGHLGEWRSALQVQQAHREENESLNHEERALQQLDGQLEKQSENRALLDLRFDIAEWQACVQRMQGMVAEWLHAASRVRKRKVEAERLESQLVSEADLYKVAAIGGIEESGSILSAADDYETKLRVLRDAEQQYAFAQTWEASRRTSYMTQDSDSDVDIQTAWSHFRRRLSSLRDKREDLSKDLAQFDNWMDAKSRASRLNSREQGIRNRAQVLLAALMLCCAGIEMVQRQWMAVAMFVICAGGLLFVPLLFRARNSTSREARNERPPVRFRVVGMERLVAGMSPEDAFRAIKGELQDIDAELQEWEQREPALNDWQQAVRQTEMRYAELKTVIKDYERCETLYKALLADVGLDRTLWTKAELLQLSSAARAYLAVEAEIEEGITENLHRGTEMRDFFYAFSEWISTHRAILPGARELSANIDAVVWEDEQSVQTMAQSCDSAVANWRDLAEQALHESVALEKIRANRQTIFSSIQRRQLQIEHFEKQIQTIFYKLGVPDWENYQFALEREEKRWSLRREWERVMLDLTVACSSERAAARVLQKLKQTPPNVLEAEHASIARETEALSERLRVHQEKLWELNRHLEESQTDGKGSRLRWQRAQLDAKMRSLKETYAALALARSISKRARIAVEERHSSPVLSLAGTYMERITGGRYVQLRVPLGSKGLQQIYAVDASHTHWQLNDLSRGTREQVYLALRLAVIREYRNQGLILPVILDDPLVNFDDERAHRVMDLLREESHFQPMIYLTCHTRYLDELRDLEDVHMLIDGKYQEELA